MDDLDEFEQFKAMAFNQNRRGSQSVPCTPQIPSRHTAFTGFSRQRQTSKSERRRRSTKQRHMYQNHSGLSSHELRMCNSTSGDANLSDRLSRLSMTEIWVRRLRLRHGSSSDHDDRTPSPEINVLHPEMYGYDDDAFQHTTTHEPINIRRSNPETYATKINHRLAKYDHKRSMSCKDRSRPKKFTDKDSSDSGCSSIRPRTASVPSKGQVRRPDTLPVTDGSPPKENSIEYYLVRTFSTSKKGLINRGDSFKRRKTPISTDNDAGMGLSAASSACSVASTHAPVLKVLMVGTHSVGKTSLLQQFTSSDYIANMRLDSLHDADADAGVGESKLVSVLLDEDESSLFFHTALHLQERVRTTPLDAYVLVYSVSDRDSFEQAIGMLQELETAGNTAAVILVANKGDMVRSRDVQEDEGKEIAVHFNCKYIEVSAIMNLRVDELLAGIVKQVRLSERRKKKHSYRVGVNEGSNGCIEHAARGIVDRLFKRTSPVFRSCDNLLVA